MKTTRRNLIKLAGGAAFVAASPAILTKSLSAAENERSRLQQLLDQGAGADSEANARLGAVTGELDAERQISQRALSQVELLNQQIAALRKQIAALEEALDVSEARDRESNTKIADLGRRLNVALAQRVQELNRYRSDFLPGMALSENRFPLFGAMPSSIPGSSTGRRDGRACGASPSVPRTALRPSRA